MGTRTNDDLRTDPHAGFITVINGVLPPRLRSVFELDYAQTTLIEPVWFIAYFFASHPSAKLIERKGYQRSIVIGLLSMAGGALVQGGSAHLYGLQNSFFLTMACEMGVFTDALPDQTVGN